MTPDDVDPVATGLAGLAGPAPRGLADRVFARWVTAPSRVGEMFVVFTAVGVAFLRPVTGTTRDAAAEDYRDRFGRPLLPGRRPPGGLAVALLDPAGPPVALDMSGLPAFAAAVLDTTSRIPPGEVRPYGWVAAEAGRPHATQAVRAVLVRNPLPLLVPCHRVVRVDGAPGAHVLGMETNRRLLHAEGAPLDAITALARRKVFYLGSEVTRVACHPSCVHIRTTAEARRRGFPTMGTALAEHYRACPHCRPGVEPGPGDGPPARPAGHACGGRGGGGEGATASRRRRRWTGTASLRTPVPLFGTRSG